MSPKALLILLLLFSLLLPILLINQSAGQPSTTSVTPVFETTVEATEAAETEVAPVPTAEVTIEATLALTSELTSEPVLTALVGDPARGDTIFHTGLYNAPACIN